MRDVEASALNGPEDVVNLLRQADDWTRALNGALTGLAEERLAGTDPSGVVRAEVSGSGRLRGLSIDPRGLRGLDHVQLAHAVQEAIAAAHRTMGDRLTEVMQELSGPGRSTTGADAADPLDGYIRNVLRGD
ncbi:YbaB/EbfC family nucleoid-associated protein [Nonomuraea rhodomycinica]|uniref:YbaB/EbfC family nucleoid-associated protein n=1 Tax=Nonomuraea rhodomycinica TaxID=1712872 RepID=A0A7Y6MDU7_9ACTN|nr:YbaB/EbfC family nucleoid-associated protein [Nonomuraea rhodomycinica]NUW44883.1 YbaB/EbfC family nucleoid-associated protein [Nonomuraea rhodomycinica]